MIEVDLMAGENRQADHLKRNPSGQMPTLELDNGDFVSEVTVICEYLDENKGNTDLIGKSAEDRAETRMWTRKIDLQIIEPLTSGFRYSEGLQLFKDRMRTIPEAADGLKLIALEKIIWLDGLMEGKQFVCGDRFTLADIMLFCFLNFGTTVGQAIPDEAKNIKAWFEKVKERPSATA